MAKKEKTFGDFKSAAEINECAAGLKAEGDTESLKAMAEENGIEPDIVTLYISGEMPYLCDDMTAAMGRLATELKEAGGRNKQLIETVIKPFVDSLLTDPDICRAVMDGKHTLDGIATDIWNEASKIKTNSSAYIPDEEIRDKTEEYYRK